MNTIDTGGSPEIGHGDAARPGLGIFKRMPLRKEPVAAARSQTDDMQTQSTPKMDRASSQPRAKPILTRDGFEIPLSIASGYNVTKGKYLNNSNKYLDRDSNIERFQDHGKKLSTKSDDRTVIKDMILIAEAKNWTSIKIKGSDAFKRTAWLEGEARGIKVKGFEPTPHDLAQLEALRKSLGKTPSPARGNEIAHEPTRSKDKVVRTIDKAGGGINLATSVHAAYKVLTQELEKYPENMRRDILAKATVAFEKGEVVLPTPMVAERTSERAKSRTPNRDMSR
jgi:hypothetical protein